MGMGGQEQPVVAAVPVQDPADPVDMKARRRALLAYCSATNRSSSSDPPLSPPLLCLVLALGPRCRSC